MANQDDRLGSLLTFNDIALIISTYGVLLVFNYLFEPVNSNTWIVCTFFVGIKILIVGIADITGVGKSYIVSILFVLISDGIIILINQLMAFGLSLRLMLIMVIADIIFVVLAIFIWKRLGRDNVKIDHTKDDWIYSEEAETPKAKENIIQQNETESIKETETPVVKEEKAIEAPEVEEENIFDFQPLKNQTNLGNTENKIFENFKSEPITEGEDILNFEELTQELPTQEELNQALEAESQATEKSPEESINYFEGLDFFNDFSYQEEKEEPAFTTNSVKEEVPAEPINEELEQEEIVEEIPVVQEAESIEEKEESIEEESISEVENKEIVPEIEIKESETESKKVDETVEEIEIPEVTQESEPEITLNEEFEEEEEPFFINTLNDYSQVVGSTIGFSRRFNIIPVNVKQEQIDQYKSDVNEEMIRLNSNLHKLVDEYNKSLQLNDPGRIVNFIDLTQNSSPDQNSRVLRDNLNLINEQEFVSDNVMHTLLELVSKLDNRIYNINFAEENLKERLLREQQRENERKRLEEEARREREAKERQERAERERKEREKEERAKLEAQKETEKKIQKPGVNPAISSNEVRLQSDDMDIIIDAADLELLKEFLAQQETNN